MHNYVGVDTCQRARRVRAAGKRARLHLAQLACTSPATAHRLGFTAATGAMESDFGCEDFIPMPDEEWPPEPTNGAMANDDADAGPAGGADAGAAGGAVAGAAGAAAAGGAEAGGRACDGAPGSLHGGATATQEGLAEVSDVEVGMVIDDNTEMGVLGSAAEGALVGTRHFLHSRDRCDDGRRGSLPLRALVYLRVLSLARTIPIDWIVA